MSSEKTLYSCLELHSYSNIEKGLMESVSHVWFDNWFAEPLSCLSIFILFHTNEILIYRRIHQLYQIYVCMRFHYADRANAYMFYIYGKTARNQHHHFWVQEQLKANNILHCALRQSSTQLRFAWGRLLSEWEICVWVFLWIGTFGESYSIRKASRTSSVDVIEHIRWLFRKYIYVALWPLYGNWKHNIL